MEREQPVLLRVDRRPHRDGRTHPYLVLARLAADPVAYLGLPDERVVICPVRGDCPARPDTLLEALDAARQPGLVR